VRIRSLLLPVALISVVATGCTGKSQGDPRPAPGTEAESTDPAPPDSSTAGPADLPTDGAPAVADPLDTSRFQQDPCGALTSDQSQKLNVGTSGKTYDGILGNACEWENAETRGRTAIVFLNEDPRGLSALYRANNAKKYAYFDELSPIEGYPAISRDIADDRPKGHCTVVVGTSDEIAFEAILQLSRANVGQKDACEVAAQVAGMALLTMKQGG
jgi:hypothetical protein